MVDSEELAAARGQEISQLNEKLIAMHNQCESLEATLKKIISDRSDCEKECARLQRELKRAWQQKAECEENSLKLERVVEMFQRKGETITNLVPHASYMHACVFLLFNFVFTYIKCFFFQKFN